MSVHVLRLFNKVLITFTLAPQHSARSVDSLRPSPAERCGAAMPAALRAVAALGRARPRLDLRPKEVLLLLL